MSVPSFRTEQIQKFMLAMCGICDVVRLVDPADCSVVRVFERVGTDPVEIRELDPADMTVTAPEKEENRQHCFDVWGRPERCIECSSYLASLSGRIQEKTELIEDKAHNVISVPLFCRDEDGREQNYCVELLSRVDTSEPVGKSAEAVNAAGPGKGRAVIYRTHNRAKTETARILTAAGDRSGVGIICYDTDGECIFANASAFRLFEVENDLEELSRLLTEWGAQNARQTPENKWIKVFHSSEGERIYESQYFDIEDTEGNKLGSYCSINDVTMLMECDNSRMFREAHDPLTGIFSWEGFKERALTALAHQGDERFVLIRVNVRNFKLVNQLYGVDKGNDVLCAVAKMCRRLAGKKGIYGRMISDHFVMLMEEKDFDEEAVRADALRVVEGFNDCIYKVHLQFGIYVLTDRREDISIMCDRAKMALKSITDEHQVSFARYNPELILNALYENEVISGFEEAIRKNQLHIYLQSQTDRTGKPIGAEALARWLHPEQGVIPPSKFISVLEKAGLIQELDRYIWEQAVQQLASWQGTSREELRLSVNISPKDIQTVDIEKTFVDLVRRYHVDPARLNLEITESAVIANPEHCIRLVSALQKDGFQVEIDDFGSGYSSLNMLNDLQANVLKIDRAFLQKLEQEKRSEIILSHIIQMAKDLKMGVITEGVETQHQIDMLADLGCDLFQGFFFSKPIPVSEFELKYS